MVDDLLSGLGDSFNADNNLTSPTSLESLDDTVKDAHGISYYQGLPDDLDDLECYEPFKALTEPSLSDAQSVDVLKALAFKRFNALYATGLGKTYVAAGYMRALKNAIPDSKFLMVIKKRQSSQTPRKIETISGLRCVVFTAESNSLPTRGLIDSVDCVMITHNVLNSIPHLERLLTLLDEFTALIVDEVHLLSNFSEASSAFTLLTLSGRIEYFLGLTATPITTDLKQFANLMKVTCPDLVDNHRRLSYNLKKYGLSALDDPEFDFLQDTFVIRSRPHRRRGIAEFVDALPWQEGASGVDMFVKTKGPRAVNAALRLLEVIKERLPERGVVYVNHKEVYRFIVPFLESKGIRVAVVNGDTTQHQQDVALEGFVNGEFDVVLTNAKEALDMPGSYVVFYEFTSSTQQFIGRVERGLETKALDVIYIFVENTDEWDYFIRNVVCISQEIEELFGSNLSEVTKVIRNFSRPRKQVILAETSEEDYTADY